MTGGLEQITEETEPPANGKLLARQKFESQRFYEELVTTGEQFKKAMEAYLNSRSKPRHPTAAAELGIGESAVRHYAKRETSRMPIKTYRGIAQKIGVNPDVQPDKVAGNYVGMMLAFYFDRVDKRTRGLDDPMLEARNALIAKLAEADEDIAVKLAQSRESRHAVECDARDYLTGRGGLIPSKVFRHFEEALLAHLNGNNYAVTREQLMKAFRSADPKNLEASLETLLGRFITREGRLNKVREEAEGVGAKPYWFVNNSTPRGIHYVAGNSILHPTFGPGQVVKSGCSEAQLQPGKYPPPEYAIAVRFHEKPDGAVNLVGENMVRLMVRPR